MQQGMIMMQVMGFILLGLIAAVLGGLTGIGGIIILVPALIYFFGYATSRGQGTTVAILIPPIGILYVNIPAAGLIAVSFKVGSLEGANFKLGLPDIRCGKYLPSFLPRLPSKFFG